MFVLLAEGQGLAADWSEREGRERTRRAAAWISWLRPRSAPPSRLGSRRSYVSKHGRGL